MLRHDSDRLSIESGELTVENTSYCGAECIMCPRDEYRLERNWNHMSLDLFKSVLDQGAALGITSLDLCGFGDPFMDPGYEAKLRYSKAAYPHIRTYTSTTGHLLHEKSLPWVCELFDTIKISFYGFSKESYEAVHKGVLDYEKVKKNVDRLLEVPKGRRPHVILSFLVFPVNEHETNDWTSYWESRADEVMVWLPHNYGGAESIEDLAFRTNERTHKKVSSCGRPVRGNPFVRANGDVSVCCFDFNHKLVVGNLDQASLLDILGGSQLSHVKEVHERLAFEGSGLLCEGCDQIFDRTDALIYSSNPNRKVDQPTTHPNHVVRLVQVDEMYSGTPTSIPIL